MKSKALIAVLLITMLVVQEIHAWRARRALRRVARRIKRVVRRVVKPICKKVCPRVCKWVLRGTVWKYGCSFGCNFVCGKKKREAIDSEYHVTKLPTNFDYYDLSEDGFIDMTEFVGTMGDDFDDPGLIEAFNGTDVNGDHKLSEEELFAETSLFVFAHDDEE